MKLVKGTFLFLIAVSLCIVVILFQLNVAFRYTFLSSDYFNEFVEKHEISKTLSDYFITKLNTPGVPEDGEPSKSENNQTPPIEDMVLKHLNRDWLENQLGIVIKGSQAYLVGEEDHLPALNIGPLKEGLMEGVVEQVAQREEVKRNINDITQIFILIESKYRSVTNDEELLQKIKQEKLVRAAGVSDEILLKVIDTYQENKDMDINTMNEELVTEVFADSLNLETMRNDLDLNQLFEEIFAGQNNPLDLFRNMSLVYKDLLFFNMVIIIVALLLIALVVAFNLYSFVKWVSLGLIPAALVSAGLGVVGLLGKLLRFIQTVSGGLDFPGNLPGIQSFLQSYLTGYFKFLAIQGLIILAITITAVFTTRFLSGRIKMRGWSFSKGSMVLIGRIGIFLFAAFVIYKSAIMGFDAASLAVEQFVTSVKVQTSASNNINILEAFAKVTNWDILVNKI